MNEFLNQVYFNNSVQSYLMVAAIILFVFIVRKYLARYVADFIFMLLKKRWKKIDRASFIDLVAAPLGYFLTVLIAVATLDELQFPEALDFKIYHLSFHELLQMVASFLLITTFFLFLIKCIDFIMLMIKSRYLQNNDLGNHQLIYFFKDFIKVVVGIIGILFVLKYSFGYDVKGLVTGLSIVGAAVALALKESLENLIASFIIFFDKPFSVGDIVKVNNVSGTIERIGLRSTRIRSDAKTYITVPNKQMVDSILDNQSNRTQRRADLRLELAPATNSSKLQTLLSELQNILKRPEIENFNVHLSDISSTSLIVTCEYYCSPNDFAAFLNTKDAVNLEVLQLLEKLDIEIAGEVNEIKLVKQ